MKLFRSLMLRYYCIFNLIKLKLTKGVDIGKEPLLYGPFHLKLHFKSKLTIGDYFMHKSGNHINPLSRNIKTAIVLQPKANLFIGNNVGISSCSIWVYKLVTIGNNVLIGADTIIMDSNAHSIDFIHRRNSLTDSENRIDSEIVIEDDVLIGCRCIIQKGVTIGARSVIAAGSVVTKSIPNDCIAGGNPCQVVKLEINTIKK